MQQQIADLAASTEPGRLGILHLKRYWQKSMLLRNGQLAQDTYTDEWSIDNTLLNVLGLGLEQTLTHLYQTAPSFEAFENWILDINNGQLAEDKIGQFNRLVKGEAPVTTDHIDDTAPALSEDDLAFWETNGYVIVRNAVPKEDCEEAVKVICDHIDIDRDDPSTWYNPHAARQGIMVQLFQHSILEKNRNSQKIRNAFEQLWGRKDIWLNTDRVGFNPPETATWKYPGDKIHWDVSLQLPIPFGTQGILYLAGTQENQGAFSLVPGFQHKIEEWINALPPGADPRQEDMYALGVKPIAANAGDFIIWHHALPHGSSPNTATLPRYVQYINYKPADMVHRKTWK
ncbi:MAG TPA: phytanoyl-CoA dioxygenase family protein [Chitinophagaceae bacterium]|nr:phytanoyl-CoA dioxygenase family protein [Chitinophagaceae bacterium]